MAAKKEETLSQEFEDFRVEISRELGGIAERLRSIETFIIDQRSQLSKMWERIDEQKKRTMKLETKVYIIAAIIAMVVSNADLVLKKILP